ncbi:MAG: autotransporter-associated beta strand repeat-containing protein [Luteolibacter sp.]|uniref:beta strand repeat-containing protein n=1 Tax=Luteolibacter sp. TaxID=1962973 RepID=UPI0032666D81
MNLSISSRPVSLRHALCALAFTLACSPAHATDYIKANNENNLNTNASWLDSLGNPATSFSPNGTGSTDLWTWDSRVTNANSGGDGVNDVHASDQGVKTLKILNPEVAVAMSLDAGSAGRTMTYTAGGGIDMANATQDLTIVNGFYRATGGVAAAFNVKTGRKLEFLNATTLNVRNNTSGGTVSMNTDGVSTGRIVIGGPFNPSNVVVGAGLVEFNNPSGNDRKGTNATTINGGRLMVNNTSGSATGTGSVALNSTGTLGGQGIISGAVTAASGSTIAPGNNAIGSLTVGSLSLAAGSTLNWEITDIATADAMTVTTSNGLTINGGTFNLYNPGTATPFEGTGEFTVFTYTGAISGTGISALAVSEATKVSGHNYVFAISSGTVKLLITSGTIAQTFWNVDSNGTWSTGSNWTGGVAPDAIGARAAFGATGGATITAPRTVTVNGPRTVGGLAFDSAQPFTLAGAGPLTLNDSGFAATVTVKSGNHTISSPVSLTDGGALASIDASASLTMAGEITGDSDLSKSGPGTLVLTGENFYFGGTSVGAGVLEIGANGATGSVSSPIINGGTLRFKRTDAIDFGYLISGTGNLEQAGSGTLSLTGDNTFSGTTNIISGNLVLGSGSALQNSTLNYTSAGGPLTIVEGVSLLTLGGLSGDRNLPLTDIASNPLSLSVGRNNSSTSYSGSPVGTGITFAKSGTGTFTLSGTHTYTGNATISAGTLAIATGGSFSSAAVNLAAVANTKLLVSGGTLVSSASSLVTNASGGFEVTGGSASFNGGITTEINVGSGTNRIVATGGNLNAASIRLGRSGLNLGTTEPTAGQINNGLYVNGGAVAITGTLNIGNGENSSVCTRIDTGSLSVDGAITLGINSPDRWSVLDINGGTFTSTNTASGLLLGGTSAGQVTMIIHNAAAVAKASRIQFGQAALGGSSYLNLSAGSLYVGAGGLVLGSTNPALLCGVRLSGGTLGASADSSSNVPVSLTGTATVTAADEVNTPHTVTFSGATTGSGSLTKSGAGTALFTSPSNNFSGSTTVSAGLLGLRGQAGAISVAAPATLAPQVLLKSSTGATIDGTLSISYDGSLDQVSGIQTPAGIALGAASVLSINGTGALTQGYYILVRATGGITGSFASVTGTLPSGYTINSAFNFGGVPAIALVSSTFSAYDTWTASFGLAGSDAAPSFDYDKDSMSNLLEYALQGNPTTTDLAKLPTVGNSGGFLTLTFTHIADPSLSYVILASATLDAPWSVAHTYPAFGSVGSTTYTDNVTISSQPARFLRLEVIKTP